jgi:hypothetical protein
MKTMKTMKTQLTCTSFNNQTFFPLDGYGWRDVGYDSSGNPHDFSFCVEIHSRFTYQGFEDFYFAGDDDVYVYLDNILYFLLHPAFVVPSTP